MAVIVTLVVQCRARCPSGQAIHQHGGIPLVVAAWQEWKRSTVFGHVRLLHGELRIEDYKPQRRAEYVHCFLKICPCPI
jgi:hypothetical protein